MFDLLSQKLHQIFQKLARAGRIKEEHFEEAAREIKLALLEADVNYEVVKNFIERIKEKALGEKILESLAPTQQIVKIVNDELAVILGQRSAIENLVLLHFSKDKPTVVMLVGLQGSGKTTTAGKLAHLLKGKKFEPLLAAVDPYRPAAVEQLKEIGRRAEITVFGLENCGDVDRIVRESLETGRRDNYDILILDTAGRLHIDGAMMAELVRVKEMAKPAEIFLVADGMTGQDAVNLAKTFHEKLGLTGIILTKMEGDARGGAALSMITVAQVPIKFIGVGEKLEDLEPFYPDRMATRILGMGDVVTLVEKVQENVDLKEAEKLVKKIRQNELTLADFANQLKQIRKLGPLEKILGMMPGFEMLQAQDENIKIDPKEVVKIEAMISSMTPEERENPDMINGERRRRIAEGSGAKVEELNRFIKRFFEAKKMLKKITEMMSSGQNPFSAFPKM